MPRKRIIKPEPENRGPQPLPKISGNPEKLGHVPRHAVLDEDGNVRIAGLLEWAAFFEKSSRRYLAWDETKNHAVSTVFTGLNLSLGWGYGENPLWFETMVFGPVEERELFGKSTMIRPELWTKRTRFKTEALAAHEEGKAWLTDYLMKNQ